MTEDASSAVDASRRFRLRAPDVAFQVIDGEAILIHFERGAYYSARGIGCEILKLVAAGHSIDEITQELSQRSGAASDVVNVAVEDYVARMLREDLVAVDELRGARDASGHEQREPLVFGEAELVKYTDLEDLLLLDPIHDVDDAGWPPRVEGSTTVHSGE